MVKNEKLLELFKAGDFTKLEEALLENIREEVATSKGNKTELQAVKNILKYCKKNNPALFGAIAYNDKFAFCDGFRLLVADDCHGYEIAESRLDVKKMECDTFTHEVEIDIVEVKTLKKLNKKAHYTVEVEGVKTFLNCDYVLDCFAVSKSNRFMFNQKKSRNYGCNISPLYQLADDGTIKTLLLPVILGDVD